MDSNVWNVNVEKTIMDLSYPSNYNKDGVKYGYVRGNETVNYIDQIFDRYEHYKKFIDK